MYEVIEVRKFAGRIYSRSGWFESPEEVESYLVNDCDQYSFEVFISFNNESRHLLKIGECWVPFFG